MNQLLTFSKDEHGYLHTKIIFKVWKGHLSYVGLNFPEGGETDYSSGEVTIKILDDSGDIEAPLSHQQKAVEYLIENQENIRMQMLAKLLEEFPAIAENYDLFDSWGNTLPEVRKIDDFRNLIGLSRIYILLNQKDDCAYVGYNFGCVWDSEHGLGIMTHKSRVIEIGGADASFGWVNDPEVA